MRRATLALLLAPLCAPAQDGLSGQEKADNTEMINTFSRCSAVYEVASSFLQRTGQPANAQQWHELANGAHSAALYLLNLEQIAAGKPPRALVEFTPYVDGLADTARTRMLALIEAQESAAFLAELDKCKTIAPVQEAIVQLIRNEFIGR